MKKLQFALALLLLLVSAPLRAQDEDDDDELPDFRPGLAARYVGADGAEHVRRDAALQFVWGTESPDARVAPGPFTADWKGRLFAIEPGEYQLHVYAVGHVKLELEGQMLLDAQADEPRWLAARPVRLEYGYHPLEIAYRKTGKQARIGLYWSGPKFQLEPVPDRHLFHDPGKTPDDRFAAGEQLSRALRCGACHQIPGEREAPPAPDLTRLSGNLSRCWLVDWLKHDGRQPAGDKTPTGDEEQGDEHKSALRHMPAFHFTADEAAAIAACLLDDAAEATKEKSNAPPIAKPADRQAGETLFHSLGCLACHRQGELGAAGLFGGGDLTNIAAKRPADFFARWLAEPAKINAAHRMPVFKLTEKEQADLAAYLATLGANDSHNAPEHSSTSRADAPPTGDRQLGKQLIAAHRCGACHTLPKELASNEKAPPTKKLAANSAWAQGCLNPPDRTRKRPGYALSPAQRDALEAYFRELPPERGTPPLDGRFVLAERNCVACHARGPAPGIAGRAEATIAAQPDLAPLLASLAPPALTGVGDKLHDEALAAAITLKQPPLRPWLLVRMPRFELSKDEMRALTEHFIAADRIPDLPAAEPSASAGEAALKVAGSRLVTAEGFGCTSCHQIGKSLPVKVAPAAHGTDLSLLGKRIRRTWYDRWVRNPARIVPRMEMPSIQVPVRGVLGERLDDQLAAVWSVLNTRGFDPPQPHPVRIIRARNLPGQTEPAAALTDVLEVGGRAFVKPLAIGLTNRHNVLIDLETNRLAGWWLGDTARERTRGKSWYWEAGGAHVLPPDEQGGESEFSLRRDGRLWPTKPASQFAADLDWYELTGAGLRFGYELAFGESAERGKAARLNVVQTIVPLPGDTAGSQTGDSTKGGGFVRRWEIVGAKPGDVLELALAPAFGKPAQISKREVIYAAAGGQTTIRLPASAKQTLINQDGLPYVLLTADAEPQPLVCEAVYLTSLPADRYLAEPAAEEPEAPFALNVVPGYEAIRLPLPPSEMPTGLAWRDDGALIFCSLKGSVWVARDTDGDGLEDRQTLFADGLPAPYGIAAHGADIDVCAKYALLRLSDGNGDGRAERAVVAASGWGYTTDYHDWAVGLPRTTAGHYYLGLPCQQDDRSPRAAYLRGTVVELIPRQPTAVNPRLFDLKPLAAGLRFPMGLALNRAGDLFCTDNQGNYTPFNELNYLHAGTRYGFINKLEQQPGFAPPFESPAINIPHPWTRSINGICFLNTPEAVQKSSGRHLFGAWEGHLVGCEFDTRRLIRMSLERIGDSYQGAAYPLSVEAEPGQPTFEGPISCALAPDGDLYIGNLRDSGWGGGQNTGSIVRLRPHGALPSGIAEVRAAPDGFLIDFTQPVEASTANDLESYAISSYRRIPTPAYGGPDLDREPARLLSIELSSDRLHTRLKLAALRPGFVYEIRLKPLAPADELFFPTEAYYTLQRIPQ